MAETAEKAEKTEKTAGGRRYEMMALVEPTFAAKEWNRVVEEITQTVEKRGAKVLLVNKWGERKLAYPIRRVGRGTYVLVYFEGPKDAPAKIKADFVLSEFVMRTLIVKHDGEVAAVTAPPEEPPRPRPMVPKGYR